MWHPISLSRCVWKMSGNIRCNRNPYCTPSCLLRHARTICNHNSAPKNTQTHRHEHAEEIAPAPAPTPLPSSPGGGGGASECVRTAKVRACPRVPQLRTYDVRNRTPTEKLTPHQSELVPLPLTSFTRYVLNFGGVLVSL